jgi:peptidoglycan hydrolase-like protein with peptidoglycan-binding domain
MIPSPNHSSRNGKRVRLVVVHTAEGARTVESLGAFFKDRNRQVSSHVGIDDKRIETYVDPERQAFTLRSGNAISENAELCGFAAWSREEWLEEHHRMLELTAEWIADRCLERDIPVRKLTPPEVAAGEAGVIGHIDWTKGMHEGTHTDPGPGFPWDVVMAMANGINNTEGNLMAPVLREGDGQRGIGARGRLHWYVVSVQALCNIRGLSEQLPVDGVFGPKTTDMVKELQKRSGVPADGVVNAATWPWLIGNDAPDFV